MTYWISFAADRNLGVIITDAETQELALNRTKELGIFPGGEAMFIEFPQGNKDADYEIKKWGKDRLISPDELANDGYVKLSEIPEDVAHEVVSHPSVSIVCEECTE